MVNGTLEEALPENHTSRKTILGHCVVSAMTMGEGEQRVRQQPTELNIDELVAQRNGNRHPWLEMMSSAPKQLE